MADDVTPKEAIRENAALVVAGRAREGVILGYDEAGVAWLDVYIDRNRASFDAATTDRLVGVFGAYLGECIRRQYGGAWARERGTWAIRFDDRNAAYPFAKVAKHFANGPEDSILGLFTLIPRVFRLDARR